MNHKEKRGACPNTNQHLEPFLILAKTAKGAALKALIIQVLEANGVYVFGEFLELPCVTEVSDYIAIYKSSVLVLMSLMLRKCLFCPT